MSSKNILCISYDSASEPIPQSQLLSYLIKMPKGKAGFCWLSFEKKHSPLKLAEKKKSFRENLLKDNIKWYALPYHKKPYLPAKIFDILTGVIYGSYLIMRNNIKIVHGRSEVASVICLVLKLIFNVKFVYDRRGYMAEDYVEGGLWNGRENMLYKLLKFIDKKLLLSSDETVVLTERVKHILIEENGKLADKLNVIPCCVDLERFKFREAKEGKLLADLKMQDKFIFIYHGSLGTWYMIDEMIDFFIVAKTQIPNAHFLILTMSDHNIAEDAFRRKNLEKTDFTILESPPSLVQNYVSLADAALIFIKPVFSKLSSSPTKFAESLSCGLPVIINSNIGDCDEMVKTNGVGVIVDKFESDDYKKAINKLIDMRSEKIPLSRRCRKTAEDFYNLTSGAYKYWQIYSRLLS